MAHTLAPDLIPNIHFAATNPPLLIVDRVEDVPLRSEGGAAKEEAARCGTAAKLAELGINIDSGVLNFAINAFGLAVYVDSLEHYRWQDLDRTESAIADMPEEAKIKALHYLKRLKQIWDPLVQ